MTQLHTKLTSRMDYFRPPFAINSRPPLFHPRMEHFHFMPPGPGPFHPASPAHFAMATPSGIGLYLQRPPLPPPPHLPMYGAGPYSLHNHSHNLQHGDHQHPPKDHRRQRPSRRVRQRTKRQPEKAEKSEEDCREDDIELIPMATESGYDTTGDCHTPVTPLSSPLTADGETKFSTATKELSTITDEGSYDDLALELQIPVIRLIYVQFTYPPSCICRMVDITVVFQGITLANTIVAFRIPLPHSNTLLHLTITRNWDSNTCI